jgi:hypothetical protein
MLKITTISIALIALLTMGACALAEEITFPVTEYSVFSDSIDNPRLVTKFTLTEGLADTMLVFAEISFDIIPEFSSDSILQFDCIRLTTEWSPNNVSWSSPWTNPGGDYDTLMTPTMFATTETGAQTAYFDITEIVRDWLRGNATNEGLIFKLQDGLTSGFAIDRLPELPNNAIASVKIVTQ